MVTEEKSLLNRLSIKLLVFRSNPAWEVSDIPLKSPVGVTAGERLMDKGCRFIRFWMTGPFWFSMTRSATDLASFSAVPLFGATANLRSTRESADATGPLSLDSVLGSVEKLDMATAAL